MSAQRTAALWLGQDPDKIVRLARRLAARVIRQRAEIGIADRRDAYQFAVNYLAAVHNEMRAVAARTLH